MTNVDSHDNSLDKRIYKYAKLVSRTEAKITTVISDIACIDITEDEWDVLCQYVSNELYNLVQIIMEREHRFG